MHPEFSLAYLTVFGVAPPDMISLAAKVGYDYVGLRLIPVTPEEPAFSLVENRTLLRETQQRLRDTGMRVLDVELIRVTPQFEIDSVAATLDIAAELQARHILAQAPDSNIARATEHLGQLCDAAQQRALTVDVEFVTWTETSDLHKAAGIVGGTNRDNAGVLVDTLHFSRSNCSVVELALLPRQWLHYVQVSDAPAHKPLSDDELIFAARNERLFPGEGGIDLRSILGAMPRDIPYAIEIPRASLARQVGLEQLARLALHSTKAFLDTVATTASPPHLTAFTPSSRPA